MKNRVTKPGLIAMNKKVHCQYCDKETTIGNIAKHEESCYMNPKNISRCVVCDSIIKNYKSSKGTCSRSCANIHFRSGEQNGNWKGTQYQTLCFANHKKECIICKEDKIVAVHHLNEDHNDNAIENLIPMCPTHHQYMHSRYRSEVQHMVDEYVRNFKERFKIAR
jgi:hypothetical protein